jgi:hypothetical protein
MSIKQFAKETTMRPRIEWLLASMVSWTGFRLDVFMVRVMHAGVVLFAGVAFMVTLPVARLDEGRAFIDTVGVSAEDADTETVDAPYEFAA